MSRALDQSVKEALKNGDHGKVFQEICGVLSQTHKQLLEIELLPPSHALPPDTIYLQDGHAIAIPKLHLVQAFLVARQKLKGSQQIKQHSDLGPLLTPLGVMLLMDPEHLTAANTRKRIIGDVYRVDGAKGRALMLREMYFVDSLLTSRLHRHTKSPTLWSHRRWLCIQLLDAGLSVDVARDLRHVIFVSAERHPRNYYAWCHARLLVETMDDRDNAEQHMDLIEVTKKWCFSHPSDISGWTFLRFLIARCHQEDVLPSVFHETVALTETFRWRNESVWCFLRSLATSGGLTLNGSAVLHNAIAVVRGGQEEQEEDDEHNDKMKFNLTYRWLELYPPQTRGWDRV